MPVMYSLWNWCQTTLFSFKLKNKRLWRHDDVIMTPPWRHHDINMTYDDAWWRIMTKVKTFAGRPQSEDFVNRVIYRLLLSVCMRTNDTPARRLQSPSCWPVVLQMLPIKTFYRTEDQLQQHHEAHMLCYEDCNICFTGHVWIDR